MELREKLNDWEEDRQIIQTEREGTQEEANNQIPPIQEAEGGEEKESAISEKRQL